MTLNVLQDTWDRLGQQNPLWAVLTSSEAWEPETFFETGRQEISVILDLISKYSISLQRERALDFGCGVGRLSQALAAHFDEVHGVDIAPSMIQAANEFNQYGARCQYHLNASNDLSVFPSGSFDLVYSNIVLQHMAPKYARNYLVEFLRVMKRQGVLVFQLPSTLIVTNPAKRFLHQVVPDVMWAAYRRAKWKMIEMAKGAPQMEMYGIEKAELTAFLADHGGRVVDALPDTRPTANQSAWDDYVYIVVKA